MTNTVLDGREVIYRPQPGFQTSVHQRLEDIVTIGGTKGPGKTQAIIGESLRQIDNPHYHAIFFRRTYPRLQEIIDRCHGIFPKLGAKWSGDLKRYTFPSGAVIDFSHVEHENDKLNHQGKEYTALFFDQLEEFTETQFDYLLAQNRTSHAGLRCYVMATHNPGGPGHGWVNRRFVKNRVSGQTYTDIYVLPDGKKVTRTSCFIRGNIYENKALLKNNPQYLAVLMALPEKLRKAFMDGNYDILEGQYFDTWNSNIHVIKPQDVEITSEYKIYQCLDWGYTKPLSCKWWAVAPDMTHAYCVGEYYVTGKLSHVAAQEINEKSKKMFGEHYIRDRKIEWMACDPSIFSNKGQTGKTIAEDFMEVMREQGNDGRMIQFTLIPSNNDRVPGWNQYRKMLAIQTDGKPFAMWFSTCENSIRTIPEMIHDEHKPEDIDTDGEDHCVDSDRYFFMTRFKANKTVQPEPHSYLVQSDPMSYREWESVGKKRKSQSEPQSHNVLSHIGS